jgi:hypothetical protein
MQCSASGFSFVHEAEEDKLYGRKKKPEETYSN